MWVSGLYTKKVSELCRFQRNPISRTKQKGNGLNSLGKEKNNLGKQTDRRGKATNPIGKTTKLTGKTTKPYEFAAQMERPRDRLNRKPKPPGLSVK